MNFFLVEKIPPFFFSFLSFFLLYFFSPLPRSLFDVILGGNSVEEVTTAWHWMQIAG